jgi:hypothetical protein
MNENISYDEQISYVYGLTPAEYNKFEQEYNEWLEQNEQQAEKELYYNYCNECQY